MRTIGPSLGIVSFDLHERKEAARRNRFLDGLAASLDRRPAESAALLDALNFWWDDPTMFVTLDAKRRLTVPVALAPARPGDAFEAEFDAEEDTLVFRRVAKQADWLAVLRACPVDMSDLPPRRRTPAKRRKL